MQCRRPFFFAGGAGSASSSKGWLRRFLTGQKQSADQIKVDAGVNDALLEDAAERTDGFSGRELAKMVASMQASWTPSLNLLLT